MASEVTSPEPALFRRRPWLRGVVPHIALGVFPTVCERVTGLLPDDVELWVKREDRAGTLYGGNKVRKLEFLLAEAKAQGCARVMTIGGWGSHHALATAIYAQHVGLGCTLALFPQPLNEHVKEQLRADVAAQAEVVAARMLPGIAGEVVSAKLARGVAYIAGGGSSPTGTLGWVSAADEIIDQITAGELPRADSIYVALGSCGTAAGLLVGLRGSPQAPGELVAVRVVERPVSGAGPTHALATETMWKAMEPGVRPRLPAPLPLRVEHDQLGRGYGHATIAAQLAVAAAAKVGLKLETTYTGKAMAQLMADAASGRLRGKRVLFINTYSSVDLAPLLARTPTLPPSVERVLSR